MASEPRPRYELPVVRQSSVLDLEDEEIVLLLLRGGVRLAARRQGISERTLRRYFQQQGVSLRDCLQRRRRELTVRLLDGHTSVATVATYLGFSSSQTFARYLRREFGTTATCIRRSVRAARPTILDV